MSSKNRKNFNDQLTESANFDKFQFLLGKIYSNNASKRKQMNQMDQGVDRFNKFWRIRSGTDLADLSKRDAETHNKILGLISRAERQIYLLGEERTALNREYATFFPSENKTATTGDE